MSEQNVGSRCQWKCDGSRAETWFRLSAKRTSPFKSAGASVQLTTGSRGVRIGGSNAGYTMLRGSVKGTGYALHSPVSPSLPLSCGTVCHHVSTGLYCIKAYSHLRLVPSKSTSVSFLLLLLHLRPFMSRTGIATCYGLDGMGERFSTSVWTGLGVHLTFCIMGTGYISRGKAAGAWV